MVRQQRQQGMPETSATCDAQQQYSMQGAAAQSLLPGWCCQTPVTDSCADCRLCCVACCPAWLLCPCCVAGLHLLCRSCSTAMLWRCWARLRSCCWKGQARNRQVRVRVRVGGWVGACACVFVCVCKTHWRSTAGCCLCCLSSCHIPCGTC